MADAPPLRQMATANFMSLPSQMVSWRTSSQGRRTRTGSPSSWRPSNSTLQLQYLRQEIACAFMSGVIDHRCGSALLDYDTLVHEDHVVGHFSRESDFVSDDH